MHKYKNIKEGKAGIIARVVAKSKSAITGKIITTFELDYSRFIHSELMTHRLFSRNAASSRAIPISKTIEQVRSKPAEPVHWGKNQPGMQAKEEVENWYAFGQGQYQWHGAANDAANRAEVLDKQGYHKQIANRILEPFVFMKTVVTSTEWNNWYYLRDHSDADPTIAELAKVMFAAQEGVIADTLQPGEWHTPYVKTATRFDGKRVYVTDDENGIYDEISLETALQISSSCCAQVSFRVLDSSEEKAEKIYKRLVESKPVHASPFEHQASPISEHRLGDRSGNEINHPFEPDTWQDGVTHVDKNGKLWSGNFEGFVQHRQLIPENVVNG